MTKCEGCKTLLGLHVYYMFFEPGSKREHVMCDDCYGKYLKEKKNERTRPRV